MKRSEILSEQDRNGSGPTHWWALRGVRRIAAKNAATPFEDENAKRKMIGRRPIEARPVKQPKETIDVLRNRLLKLAAELEEKLARPKQTKDQ
jgi:hypothetical protein